MVQRTLEQVEVALSRASGRHANPAGHREAAVAAVLRGDRAPELLFIRRAEHPSDPWSGHMAFPGGRVDAADPSPLHAARRETREEVRLDLEASARLVGRLSTLPAVGRGRPVPLVIHPFVFVAGTDHPPLEPDPREVQEAVWVPLAHLLDPARRSTLRYEHEGRALDLPCCRYRGRVIWGLTLRMFDELARRL